MMALLQRVTQAQVTIAGKTIGAISQGLLVFLAVEPRDGHRDAVRLAERVLGYRIFSDAQAKMNHSVIDIAGGVLVVPQFTLAADTQKGLRPSFTTAADPAQGESLFDDFVSQMKQRHINVATGQFGAHMQVHLCNDGPATFILRTA